MTKNNLIFGGINSADYNWTENKAFRKKISGIYRNW